MQTISEELKASLAKKNPTYKKVVELHRRLWSGGVYIYDTEIDVTNQVKQYGSVRWKFDNEDFNTWTLDNTSLVFRNDRNQWKQDNAKGYFTDPYLIAESKIVIKFGAELADGTFEVIKSFTGYIAGDPIADPSGKSVTVTIQGGMAAFGKKSAEEISTLVTDELLGENAGTEFTTDYNGVGIIVIVKRGVSLAAATEIKPVTDYTASDLNEKALPLKITLVTALTAGEKLYISYRYWYQDKLLEWLAKEVLTLNGIADHSGVSAAIFESSIKSTWTQTSQADFNTDTLTNIETVSTVGSFNQKWMYIADGAFITDPILPIKTHRANITFAGPGVGVYSIRKNDQWTPTLNYSLRFDATSNTVKFCITNSLLGLVTDLGTVITPIPAGAHEYKIEYDSSISTFKVWYDGTLKVTVVNSAFSGYPGGVRGYSGGATFTIANEYLSMGLVGADAFDGVATGTLESVVYDLTASLTALTTLTAIYTLYGGSVGIYTYTSGTIDFSADNDPAGWVLISVTGEILSALKRYVKFKVVITPSGLNTPIVDSIVITYYTSTTVIDLVDLTGMTCKQVMERLAEMPAYEIGFKADETFVYRPRFTTVPPVMDLRSDTNIENISNITDGVERVKNRVVAEFGIYRAVSDASADAQPNSIDKYGTREYPVSASNLLPAQNVNIAYAIAPTILSYTKTPRKRCTVDAMFLPQLELGDKVTLYFNEPTALYRWLYGDTDMPYGRADLEYYDEDILKNRYNFWGIVMRIEGVEFDPNTFRTKFNLVEVL